jgi:hypothetical protein
LEIEDTVNVTAALKVLSGCRGRLPRFGEENGLQYAAVGANLAVAALADPARKPGDHENHVPDGQFWRTPPSFFSW